MYLIFNEGYTSSGGPTLRRGDLTNETTRLARMVPQRQPDDTEVARLLALMLLTAARRLARTGSEGERIPLARQERPLWDRERIRDGIEMITATLTRRRVGPYQLQAAVAAVRDEAARAEETDWRQILALDELLGHLSDHPMVALNQAIAAAMVHGPTKGLEFLDAIQSDTRLAGHRRLDAVRAHLVEWRGDQQDAM